MQMGPLASLLGFDLRHFSPVKGESELVPSQLSQLQVLYAIIGLHCV